MAEYIKREALYKKLLEMEALARARVIDTPTTSPAYRRYSTQLTERNAIRHMIAEIPAADVAPVVHGWWIKGVPVGFSGKPDGYRCSVCGIVILGMPPLYCQWRLNAAGRASGTSSKTETLIFPAITATANIVPNGRTITIAARNGRNADA